MKALFLFLISFNLYAVVDTGAVNNSGTSHRQIVHFDISGNPDALPTTYSSKILVKDYNKYSDGSISITGSKKYHFSVGELILDEEGNVDPAKLAIMNGVIELYQNAYLAKDAQPNQGRK